MMNYPILEFDPDPAAILQPSGIHIAKECPPRAVVCFFQEVLNRHVQDGRLVEVGHVSSEIGRHLIYEYLHDGPPVLVFHPGIGAPLAAGLLEEVLAAGVRAVIACGGCGVLMKEIAVGHAVILTSAVRDEGISYHYLPPGREVASNPRATAALEQVMLANSVPYIFGKSWTTDAYYRETPARRALRMQEGCLVVEMEAAAFFAVAQFRGVELGQVVYGGDLVVPEGWDYRGWNNRQKERELLFRLAIEAACLL